MLCFRIRKIKAHFSEKKSTRDFILFSSSCKCDITNNHRADMGRYSTCRIFLKPVITKLVSLHEIIISKSALENNKIESVHTHSYFTQ